MYIFTYTYLNVYTSHNKYFILKEILLYYAYEYIIFQILHSI